MRFALQNRMSGGLMDLEQIKLNAIAYIKPAPTILFSTLVEIH